MCACATQQGGNPRKGTETASIDADSGAALCRGHANYRDDGLRP